MATIDISDLLAKVENEGMNEQGRCSAAEFVRMVQAIMANQNGVKTISLNGSTPISPDEYGNVDLTLAQGDFEQVLNVKHNGSLLTGESSILSSNGDITLQFQFKESSITQSGDDISYDPTGQIVTVTLYRVAESVSTQVATFQYTAVGHTSDVFIDLDISSYLVDGEQSIQIRVTNTSNAAVVQKSIAITKANLELSVEPGAAWFSSAKVSGETSITPRYYVLGVVTGKVLNVKFTGANGTKTLTTTVDTNDPTTTTSVNFIETSANSIGFFGTNGVRSIEAWISYTVDGQTIESNHITNQIIIVADASTANPMIAVQGNVGTMSNYETLTIFSWNLYNPALGDTDTSDVLFELQDSSHATTYLSYMAENVYNNVSYEFSQNISIDSSSENIDVYVVAEVDGVSIGDITTFVVDNSVDYSAVAGADFQLNPATRSNSETNPARIINAADGSVISGCVFNNMSWEDGVDGWMLNSDNRRILRILAGSSIEIPYDVYSQFTSNSQHFLTIEIDMAVRNVTNETDPVFTIGNANVNNPKGLFLKPLNGAFMTASNNTWSNADVSWQENKRTHLLFNIQYNYTLANPDTSRNSATVAYANIIRTYINAVINKEFTFDPSTAEEINAGGNIIIGQAGCDIDIYGIRIYKDTNDKSNITPNGVLKNYINTLPTGTERAKVKEANDILQGGLISLAKAKAKGYNCIVWHGQPVNLSNEMSQERYGYAEIFIYDDNGNLDTEHSGTLYGIVMKGQGTTAMGYPEWNFQYKEDKKTGSGHDEYKYNDNGTLRNVFIDSDGTMGFGKTKFGYKLEDGDPSAKKLVGKINYASSMQSHKQGATNLYNDLYELCVQNTMTDFSDGERVAVKEKPFLYFVQRTEGDSDNLKVFQGLTTFGPGKADKPTWGVEDEDLMAGECIIEGALNNAPLADMRVPFVDNGSVVTYSVKEESFMYAEETNLDFDYGDTADLHDNSGAWVNVVQDANKTSTEVPTTAQVKMIQPIINFLYLCNVGIKPWNDTPEALTLAAADDTFDYKSAYWMNGSGTGYNRFDLYRCHYTKSGATVTRTFVPAGIRLVQDNLHYSNFNCLYLLNEGESRPNFYTEDDMWYDVDDNNERTLSLNLRDELAAFLGVTIPSSGYTADAFNLLFKGYLADVFATFADENLYINKNSALFHHEFIKLLAGTDNRSKNTYYRINPYANPVVVDDVTYYRPHIEFNQDDLDTIFKTNNAGRQSKPYYILEQDVEESSGDYYWDGQMNALNNTLEAAYGLILGTAGDRQTELQDMMFAILRSMATNLVSAGETMPDGTAIAQTPLGCMDKYFFSIQKYFPAVAYNETARIRYEVPALFYGSERPAQAPLTQSLGDQLQSEREYMKRRIIMLAGYAGYEIQGDVMLFRGYFGSYTATLVPHYYLFPMSKMGNPADTPVKTNVRVPAGSSYTLNMGSAVSGNTIFLYFINDLTDIGNIGGWGNGLTESSASSVIEITSERLKYFYMYGDTPEDVTFPASQINISGSTNIEIIDCHNASTLTSFYGGISNLMRLQSIDIRGTGITALALPQTTTLQSVRLPGGFTVININKCPNLQTLTIGDFTGLTRLVINEPVQFNTLDFVMGCYSYNYALDQNVITTLQLTGVNWEGVTASFLSWLLTINNLTLTGRIQMATTAAGQMPFALKKALIDKFGDIDDENNALYISYVRSDLTGITVTGDGYFDDVDEVKYYDLIPSPAVTSNTIRSYVWEITGGSSGIDPEEYASVDQYGNVTCLQMGVESGGTGPTVTLTCTVTLYDGSTLTASMDIRCYFRQAKIGDYVYHDGTWDDRLNVAKSVIGICFYCKKVVVDGVNDWYDRRMIALTNLNTRQWGLYPAGAAMTSSGFPSSGDNALTYDLNGVATAPFNVPNISEFTTGAGIYGTYANMVDESSPSEDYESDDPQRFFKVYSATHALGCLDLKELSETLKSGVLSSNDLYSADSQVPVGFRDTVGIIFHRNRVLSGTTYNGGTDDDTSDDVNYTYFKPSDSNRGDLANQILAIRDFAENTLESEYPTIYSQYLYPAASEAFAYEPTVASGNTLADKFKANNWYLPSIGELARIYFLSRVCYNQDSHYEADAYNLFGDIFSNAVAAGVATRPTTSYYWASTEYSTAYAWHVGFSSGIVNTYYKYATSNVVRPVAAF